jgi:hypothetical protein
MKRIIGEFHSHKPNTEECLLRQDNFVSNSALSSFGNRQLAWEASTLPLSYTRSSRLHYALAPISCQDDRKQFICRRHY